MLNKSLLLKIIIVGESGVGKSSLLRRYVDNQFMSDTKSTIGADFLSKYSTVDGNKVTLQIWDTAGQERFASLVHSFYRGSDGVIFVIDVTVSNSLTSILDLKAGFLYQINEEEEGCTFPMICLANKVDDLEGRVISSEMIQKWSIKNNIPVFECSAKTGANVGLGFEKLTRMMISENHNNSFVSSLIMMLSDLSGRSFGNNEDKGCCS